MPILISVAEIEALPGDPRQRFVAMDEICRNRTNDIVKNIPDVEGSWRQVQEARRNYMATMVAAAKHYKIDPIDKMVIPKMSDWHDDGYEDFQNELDFYAVQMALEGADRNSQLCILLQGGTKDRLLTLLAHMRDQIHKLDITPARRDALLDKLHQFEKDLEGRRLNIVAMATLALAVAGVVADVGTAGSIVRQLMNDVETAIGQAKEEQDKAAIQQIPHFEMKKLEPPREPKAPPVQYASYDLDDEIPF